MATVNLSDVAYSVADKWGPAVTKAIKDNDPSDYRALFDDGLIEVVLQGSDGNEVIFGIGDDHPNATLDWECFIEMSRDELKEQDYVKTESLCLGILGPRVIMETGRVNSRDEVYIQSVCMLTLDPASGKIIAYDAFTDPGMSSLQDLAQPAGET